MNSGALLVNKPAGITSRKVVDLAIPVLGTRKVGHAGTLDPFAHGLLIVAWGKATRLIPFLQEYSKTYLFRGRFGQTTDTQDCTGRILEERDSAGVDSRSIQGAMEAFRGEIEQVPPMFSALRVQGTRLYDHARSGLEVERQPRMRTVHAFELTGLNLPEASFMAQVSSGTYIRTLAHDLGESLGCGATVMELQRTAIGPHALEDALELAQLEDPQAVFEAALSLEAMLPDWKTYRVRDPEDVRGILHGSWQDPQGSLEDGRYRLVDENGALLALARGGPEFRLLGVFASPKGKP